MAPKETAKAKAKVAARAKGQAKSASRDKTKSKADAKTHVNFLKSQMCIFEVCVCVYSIVSKNLRSLRFRGYPARDQGESKAED